MKKIFLILLAICLVCSFVGCAPTTENSENNIGNNSNISNNEKPSEPAYFEECAILVMPDSVISGITSAGSSKSTTNGVVTEIEYRYNGNETNYSDYINYLNNNGMTLQSISNTENFVIDNGMKIASVTQEGNSIIINIIPEDFRVVSIVKDLTVGSSETLDFAQFSFSKIEVTKEVYPEDASGVCLYYPESEGKTFITLRGRVKNLAAENLDGRYINAKIVINNKYTYSGEVIFGANPAALTDYAITPFEESPLYFIFSVPSEAVSAMTSGLITVQFNDNFARGGEEYQYTYNFVVPY